jgi:hypothetical protein
MRKDEPRYRDDRFIGIDDPMEIAYWLKFFDTTRDELLAAISAVGMSAEEVRRHLRIKFERATSESSSENA